MKARRFSSVTDPYQLLEARYKLTRQILQKLTEEQPSVEVLTKSRLVHNLKIQLFDTLNEDYSEPIAALSALPRKDRSLRKCKENGLSRAPYFPICN